MVTSRPYPPIAPNQSASHQHLLAQAQEADQDVMLLREMLWLIVAHDHLLAFAVAVERLIRILTQAPAAWQETLQQLGMMEWKPLLEWLQANENKLSAVIGAHYSERTNTAQHNPIVGRRSDDFPMYAVLCELLPPGIDGDRYILITGQLLMAQVAALKEHSKYSDYESHQDERRWSPLPNDIYGAALAVRRLSGDAYLPFLAELPLELSPEDFAEELEEIEPKAVERLPEDHRTLTRFLQKCWELLDWRERNGSGSGSGQGGHRWVGRRLEVGAKLTMEPQTLGDPDDDFIDWGGIDIVTAKTTTRRRQKQRLETDLDPDEDDDDEDVVFSDYPCEETKRDLGALARNARAKARHIGIANQNLPWSYEGLALEEVAALLERIGHAGREMASSATWAETEILQAETLALVHVMLWTGGSIERAAGLRVAYADQAPIEPDLSLIVPAADSLGAMCWRIKAIAPQYKTEFTGFADQIRERRNYFELPDVVGCLPLLRPLIQRPYCSASGKPLKPLKHGEAIFTHSAKQLKTALTHWLNGAFPGHRVTPAKLAGFLPRYLLATTGDPTMVTAITGVMHRLSSVRIFYSTLSIGMLQEHYRETITRTVELAYAAIGKSAHLCVPWLPTVAFHGAVGGRVCPTKDAVRQMVSQLHADIKREADYTDRQGFIRYHNCYALYALLGFAYATSCRAIVTPYLPLESIDPVRGIASLSDKDDETRHKTRLIWVTEAIRAQMACYQRHQRMIMFQLPRTSGNVLHEPIFLLDEECKPVKARPKTIEPLLQRYLNVKANTHRRFLRTELIEQRCPPEVVDALLGHWQQGEEPFGIYSSFSFARYVETLREFLLPILSDLGFDRVIASRLAPWPCNLPQTTSKRCGDPMDWPPPQNMANC